MQGIILAAGMGKRLKELTHDNTKCMVKVNGISIIERTLRILDKKNLSRIVIVVGYKSQNLIQFIETLCINTPIVFVENSIYYKTNNIFSLALAKDYLCQEDTLLLESDIVFEEGVIDALLNDPRETLALVDKFESWMDGTCMELDQEDCIINFIPGKYLKFSEKEKYYKTVNIYKFSSEFSNNTYVPFLTAYEKSMGENEYYESVIKLIAMLETKEIRARRLSGQVWYEIDNIQDLDIAESLFVNNEGRYNKISSRYGGYWRYPKLLDFCYLVNPYYPPTQMKEEMISNFETLLTEYPSGLEINSLLAAGIFGLKREHIVVGNGASELIKALMENLTKTNIVLGCVFPTFEEYPNRYDRSKIVSFIPSRNDFQYDADELMKFYDEKDINALLLINPDNPSGNYISYAGCLKLIEWAKKKNIKMIIDESFVDFVDLQEGETIEDITLLKEKLLSTYDGLYVLKSISKSYGVPGVRLGILASHDEELISKIKKDVSIWNINSFGEFFLQIKEKYDKDYIHSLDEIRKSRKELVEGLSSIPYLEVYPSQANYVMCKVNGILAQELCDELLKRNIFIKNLTHKIKNGKEYVRIAVRNEHDNHILMSGLKSIEYHG